MNGYLDLNIFLQNSIPALNEELSTDKELIQQILHSSHECILMSDREGTILVANSRIRAQEEKVDEMKNEFISIVSHELRTPLSSVLGFVEILLEREVSPEKQKKYVKTFTMK